ncbi:ferrous iron transport protein B, partial [Pseudomonas aeruginosa]|nr:ferrous iron transport protein B [Pseudomonas aeruginosa]
RRLGCPVVPLVSTRADGIDELKAAIDSLQLPQAALAVDYPPAIQAQVGYLLETRAPAASAIEPRWLALQALEGDIFNGPALGLPPATLEQARQGCGEEPE